MRAEQKIILITGVTRGLGRELLEFKLQLVPQRRPKPEPELEQRRVAVRSNYCFNLKKPWLLLLGKVSVH